MAIRIQARRWALCNPIPSLAAELLSTREHKTYRGITMVRNEVSTSDRELFIYQKYQNCKSKNIARDVFSCL